MDTSEPLKLALVILPKVPLIGKTAVYHTLGFSSTSSKWDLRTEVTVSVLRSFMKGTPKQSLSQLQRGTLRDPGIKGKLWVSKVTAPIPTEDDIRLALFDAIESMKEPGEKEGGYTKPELLPVEAEWTGYRVGATKDSAELRISEKEKYTELMREATSPTTVLYLHGGAYFLLDPSSHRPTTAKLAQLTKGRAYSVRYRLAPQNPFPAALLDALLSYLTLLYPSTSAIHEPVDPKHIVFAGDSAGGNLCMVLLQLILQLRRQGRKIMFNGEMREVPVPAGVATNSAWLDVTQSSPSWTDNWATDYLPSFDAKHPPPPYPPCKIWPSSPPRNNLYVEDALLCHPLVSPLAAKPGGWEGACPLFMESGEELLSDENRHVASVAASQGVTVIWEEFEAMPHCFAMLFPHLRASKRCYEGWANFINAATGSSLAKIGAVTESGNKGKSSGAGDGKVLKTRGVRIRAKALKEEGVDVLTLSSFTEEEVRARMRAKARGRNQPVPESLVSAEMAKL